MELIPHNNILTVGVIGSAGQGTMSHFGGRADIINGTLGKALGGASGGYTCGAADVIEMLRQKSRPYIFSNTLAPPIVAACIRSLEIIKQQPELISRLRENTQYFRTAM